MRIRISLSAQKLFFNDGLRTREFDVSTSRYGADERRGSGGTPRGRHVVRAKIGAGASAGTVFVGRRPTGEVLTPELYGAEPERDWILSRILWLSGLERGRNRLGNVDSMSRYIYIHGCADQEPVGIPRSHGCIRMRNEAVIELFELVPLGTSVLIQE